MPQICSIESSLFVQLMRASCVMAPAWLNPLLPRVPLTTHRSPYRALYAVAETRTLIERGDADGRRDTV